MAPVTFKNTVQSTSAVKKKKKPPACDYCKARRVICHPQPDGKPCPRCVEKEVTCTTTPVVRRKPKRRTEGDSDQAASAPAPSAAAHSSPSTSSSARARAKSRDKSGTPPAKAPPAASASTSTNNAVLAWRDTHNPLPPPLVQELMKLFPFVPQSQLPIVPYRRIYDKLEACGWDPVQLDVQSRVLAQCIMAVTSRVSTHPALVGADVSDAQLAGFLSSGNLMMTPGLDLRELGRRRDPICRRLHEEACQLAHEAGIMMMASEENAASLYLLDFLESSTNQYDNPTTWTAAMTWQMRSLAESEEYAELFGVNFRRLHWPVQLMNVALLALCAGRSIPFTEHDERLLCGPAPPNIEAATFSLANGPVTGKNIGAFLYPFLHHVIQLARQSSESIIGPYAKRFPLNEAALINHISAVEALQKTCVFLHDCIEFAIPRVRQDWVRPALANGYFITGLAMPSLLVPLHRELRRRLAEGSVSVLHRGTDGIGEYSLDTTDRTRHRIELLHRQVRAMALHAIASVTKRARDLPSLPYLTHLHCSRFASWTHMLLEECDGDEISIGERYATLERLCDILRLDGFAWVDRSGSLPAVEAEMALLQAQQQLVPHYNRPDVPNGWQDDLAMTGNPAAYDDSAFGAMQADGPRNDRPPSDSHVYDGAWNLSINNHAPTLPGASITPDFPGAPAGMPGLLEDSQMLEQALLQSSIPMNFGPS
ncbi:uncharacterized protein SCHCODRAFT_02537367 [Schizophyllum commune H4-8]|uniref:uncharacterized protein n=1 Tax=Schizophyllum commune (strain H4-8 / FGSC 9210) TaxID=578458 RepID=UPI0021606297|nr:uncharacterized protein SCHCODRAFT_02537367 [Schizophyllum commune H4-8]KAI5895868.1 hypothetical protein SCHCODRAFT_02537367 [Schizophyllum commune H4-8]